MANGNDAGRMAEGAAPEHEARRFAQNCHEIIDAISSIIVNVEFVATAAEGPKRAAADDALRSLQRLVKLVRALRNPSSGAKAA